MSRMDYKGNLGCAVSQSRGNLGWTMEDLFRGLRGTTQPTQDRLPVGQQVSTIL